MLYIETIQKQSRLVLFNSVYEKQTIKIPEDYVWSNEVSNFTDKALR